MSQSTHSIPTRIVSVFLATLVAMLGCRPTGTLDPISGSPDYQATNFIAVPGGWVNAAAGNLFVHRVDMSIDTLFGTQEIAASYNSASGEWLWNFQISYDGTTFIDPTGAVYPVGAVPDTQAIPGSIWVKVDANTIESKGGLAFHFGASGNLDHIRWATLDYPRIQYVASRLGGVDFLTVEQCPSAAACTPLFEIELNQQGDPVAVDDVRTARRAEYEYQWGRLVRVRDPLSVEAGWEGTQYEYEDLSPTLLAAVENPEGERIEYEYQTNRRIVDVVQVGEGNPTHHFEFNAPKSYSGNNYATFHTNPLGGITRYWIDAARRVVDITLVATGESEQISWAGLRPSVHTAMNEAKTYFTYTGDDLTEIVEPSGNTITITHQLGGINQEDHRLRAIASVEDSMGWVSQRSYDSNGRLVSVRNGAGDTVTQSWSPIALASTTNPLGATFDFPIYGVHGHWLEMDGAGADRRSIDPVGNVLIASTGRQQGGILKREYDPNRNVSALTVAATANGSVSSQDVISIQRRSDGELLYVARPGGGDHRFSYDALGRPTSRDEFVDGIWQPTTFDYDLAGSTTAVTRPNGMREEYRYDPYGRLIAHRALRDGIEEGEETFDYQRGQIVSRTDSIRDAIEIYGYDASARLVSVTFPFGESVSGEYDLRSRLIAETLSSPDHGVSRRIEYAYDLANRVTRLGTDNGELLASWVLQDGAVTEIQYGNGLRRTLETDPATGRMISAVTENDLAEVVGTTVVATTIEIAPSREQIRAATDTTIAQTVERYSMSRGGHLSSPDGYVGQRVFSWDDEAARVKSFAYDEMSNWVDNVSGDTFGYNAERNRLVSAALFDDEVTLGYTYDEAGFATSRGGVPITWTASGRMASFGADSITWDLQGRPISRSVGGQNLEFVYFGGRLSNDPQTGALLPLDLGVATIAFDTPGRSFRHFDFRNNVSFVSDESGEITSHYQYSPYGVDAVYGSDVDAVRFVGRQQVGELMWLGARIYDPLIGRFLSPDPIFNLVNQFTYTLGNPIRYWDPDGRESEGQAAKATLRPGLAVISAGAAVLAVLGCGLACGGLAAAIAFALAIDALATSAAVGPGRGPGFDMGADLGAEMGGIGGNVPSCGLLGIEPFMVLAFLRRRRQHRKVSLKGGRSKW